MGPPVDPLFDPPADPPFDSTSQKLFYRHFGVSESLGSSHSWCEMLGGLTRKSSHIGRKIAVP